jgi:putative addiction module component (TIGR02574 family)
MAVPFDFRHLSIPERIALVQAIWDSIVAESDAPLLTETQRLELERRLAEDEANPEAVVSWEQVEAEARARFRR